MKARERAVSLARKQCCRQRTMVVQPQASRPQELLLLVNKYSWKLLLATLAILWYEGSSRAHSSVVLVINVPLSLELHHKTTFVHV